jgi:hypothetical protein
VDCEVRVVWLVLPENYLFFFLDEHRKEEGTSAGKWGQRRIIFQFLLGGGERDGKRKVVFGIKEVGVKGEYLTKPFRLRTSNRKLKEKQWKRLS